MCNKDEMSSRVIVISLHDRWNEDVFGIHRSTKEDTVLWSTEPLVHSTRDANLAPVPVTSQTWRRNVETWSVCHDVTHSKGPDIWSLLWCMTSRCQWLCGEPSISAFTTMASATLTCTSSSGTSPTLSWVPRRFSTNLRRPDAWRFKWSRRGGREGPSSCRSNAFCGFRPRHVCINKTNYKYWFSNNSPNRNSSNLNCGCIRNLNSGGYRNIRFASLVKNH